MDQKEFKKFLRSARACANRHWKELLNKDELRYKHPGGFVPVLIQTAGARLIGFLEFKVVIDDKDASANTALVIYERLAPTQTGCFVKYDPCIIQIDELISAFPLNRD